MATRVNAFVMRQSNRGATRQMTNNGDTFDQWYRKVNACVQRKAGVCCDDLPDCDYRDLFEAGLSPVEAADEVLTEAGFPGDLL